MYHHSSLHSMTNLALQSDQICQIAAVIPHPKQKVYPPAHDVHDT